MSIRGSLPLFSLLFSLSPPRSPLSALRPPNTMSTARIATDQAPCFVCKAATRRQRSMTHLNGPPQDPKDCVRICLDCDEAWTASLTREQTDNHPPSVP